MISVIIDGRAYADLDVGMNDMIRRFNDAIQDAAQPLSVELKRALDEVNRDMVRRHGKPWSSNGKVPTGSSHLYTRTGAGLASISRSVRAAWRRLPEMVYATIGAQGWIASHEEAKVITPKRKKYLAIPLPPALDHRGLPLRRGPRDWDNTFVGRSRRGNLLIFRRVGTRIIPLYLLARRAYQPARLGLSKSIDRQLKVFEKRAISILEQYLDKA